MLLLALFAIGLYQIAKKKEMKNKWLWPVLGVLGYFTGAFVTGIILAYTNPGVLDDETKLNIYAVVGAALGMGAIYIIQQVVIKRALEKTNDDSEDIMDNNFDDF